MKPRYLVILCALLLVEHVFAIPSVADARAGRKLPLQVYDDQRADHGRLVREKRAPLGKLALLGGAALVGKKALLLGGAAVGAKALLGAGLLGAGLYKAKHYGGGYHHAPPTYAGSSWGYETTGHGWYR